MENTKVDLKKLNEQDWEKYRKMRKVASRQKLNAEIVAALVIGIFLVALVVGFIYISASALNHANALANYSNNQTVAVLHNLNIPIILLFALFYTIFFTSMTSSGIPRTYKYFRKELNRLAERDENLRAYGYTEQEIAWYHAIRSELIKLELEYQM